MSLYDVVIRNTNVGSAGESKILVIGFFPHIHEARAAISEWAFETFVGPFDIEIVFVSHSNTIYPTDIVGYGYERIVVLEDS